MSEAPKPTAAFSHHAFCVVSGARDKAACVEIVKTYAEREAGALWWDEIVEEKILISHVRGVIERQALQKKTEETHVIIIAGESIQREAQHALLKVLEEPSEGVVFFLVVPHRGALLPTVLSRLADFQEFETLEKSEEMDETDILALSYKERLELVDATLKADAVRSAPLFISIEKAVARAISLDILGTKAAETLTKTLYRYKRALMNIPQTRKYIFETLMLLLPVKNGGAKK